MRPAFWNHFWSRAGGGGGPTRESKASQDKDQISTVPIKKTRPFLPQREAADLVASRMPPTPFFWVSYFGICWKTIYAVQHLLSLQLV